jgi:ABC-2 type transport system permease protein
MSNLLILLSPRYKKLRRKFEKSGAERKRLISIGLLVAGLWAVLYIICVKALIYFTSEEMFGIIAATKLLSMTLATLAVVAVISNIITSFSAFFLSEDLELIIASPIPASSVYTVRFFETLLESSWMVLLFGLPVFLAYGRVFAASWSFYALTLVGFCCLLVIITAAAIFVIQNLVKTFPIRRLRDLFVFIGLMIFVAVYLLFRMMRPEDFLNPEGFASVMDYLSIMSESSSPLLPTTWLTSMLRPYITGNGFEEIPLFLGLLVSGAVVAFRLGGHSHELIYFQAYSRAVESRGARLSKSRLIALFGRILSRFMDRSTVHLVLKETLLMVRDWGRLSQLFLLLALILVYLYNFSVLPTLDSPDFAMFLKSTIAFLNIGLAGFVLSSLGVRFLFPAISGEGRAFWILKGSPIALRKILWLKFFFYLVPMLILGLFLVIMTNYLLGVGRFMSIISTVTLGILTVGITSLSVNMGVIYADLKNSDPNRAFTGIGGLLTMLYSALAVTTVILLEVFPVYRIVTAGFFHRIFTRLDYILTIVCFAAALGVAVYLIVQPLRIGMKRITELEV